MTYMEKLADLLIESAKEYCGTEATRFELRQLIAKDILRWVGQVARNRDVHLYKKVGEMLAVFPILKKDAEGVFLKKIQETENLWLDIQVKLRA